MCQSSFIPESLSLFLMREKGGLRTKIRVSFGCYCLFMGYHAKRAERGAHVKKERKRGKTNKSTIFPIPPPHHCFFCCQLCFLLFPLFLFVYVLHMFFWPFFGLFLGFVLVLLNCPHSPTAHNIYTVPNQSFSQRVPTNPIMRG